MNKREMASMAMKKMPKKEKEMPKKMEKEKKMKCPECGHEMMEM